jgi:pSer/pThr/pTyr-binding forkhead associated (FHA) protein
MICPVKTCKYEIDDDSKYCDQCGTQILVCPKCGTFSSAKFCPKDGQRMEPVRKTDKVQTQNIPSSPPAGVQPQPSEQIKDPRATTRMDINEVQGAGRLNLVHSSGTVLSVNSGDLLGRKSGPHAGQLGEYKYVSGSHAVISRNNNQWYIKDLDSTNKTRVNGKVIEAQKDIPVKHGDKIILADQEYIINEN